MPTFRCTATNLNGNQCRHTATRVLSIHGENVRVCTLHHNLTETQYLNRRNVHPRRPVETRVQQPLRNFLADKQNVHTTVLIKAQKPILDTLIQYYRNASEIPSLHDVMQIYKTTIYPLQREQKRGIFSRMKHFFLDCFMISSDELTTFVRNHILPLDMAPNIYYMHTQWMDGSEATISYTQLFRVVLARICSIRTRNQYRTILLSRLMEELRDSTRYCTHGRCCRLLNVFSGFEEVVLGIPPVDPRSLNEKLGAAFAVLREKDEAPEKTRQGGLEILLQHGVIDADKQAEWLDAL